MASSSSKEFLDIGNLETTLDDAKALEIFGQFLRAMDGKAKAAPEIKGIPY